METTDTIRFNTRRQYSPEGQFIEAEVLDRKGDIFGTILTVRFADQTRGVYGQVRVHDDDFNQAGIMRAYDDGRYLSLAPFTL